MVDLNIVYALYSGSSHARSQQDEVAYRLPIWAYLLYLSAFSFEFFMVSILQSLELGRQNGVARLVNP